MGPILYLKLCGYVANLNSHQVLIYYILYLRVCTRILLGVYIVGSQRRRGSALGIGKAGDFAIVYFLWGSQWVQTKLGWQAVVCMASGPR